MPGTLRGIEFAVDKAEINIIHYSAIAIDPRSLETMILYHAKLDIDDTFQTFFPGANFARCGLDK